MPVKVYRALDVLTVAAPMAGLSSGDVTGVVVVSLPVAAGTRPARLTLDPIGPTRGERAGDPSHPAHTRRA